MNIYYNENLEELNQHIAKTKNWSIYNGIITPALCGHIMHGVTDQLEELAPGFGYHKIIMTYEDVGYDSRWIMDEDFVKSQYKLLIKDYKVLQNLLDIWIKREKEFYDYIKQLDVKGIQLIGEKYDEFLKIYLDEYTPAIILEYFYIGNDEIVANIQEKYPNFVDEIFQFTAPINIPFTGEHDLSLLKISLLFKQHNMTQIKDLDNYPEIKEQLQLHQKKFFWIQNNYKHTTPINSSTFFNMALEESKSSVKQINNRIFELQNYDELQKKKQFQLSKKINLSSEDERKLLWVSKTAWWFDRRKRANLVADHYLNLFFIKASEKYNIKLDLLQFLYPEEFKQLLIGKLPDLSVLKQRTEGCLQLNDIKGDVWIIYGKHFKELKNKIFGEIKFKDIKDFRGITASHGNVQGIVRKVKTPQDEFHEGEILVTGMTRPEFVPLMKKAKAIITDEGGITSHAAVISRELKIPCIVGTRISTKILNTGDLVEVNTNHGSVRIIKKV